MTPGAARSSAHDCCSVTSAHSDMPMHVDVGFLLPVFCMKPGSDLDENNDDALGDLAAVAVTSLVLGGACRTEMSLKASGVKSNLWWWWWWWWWWSWR